MSLGVMACMVAAYCIRMSAVRSQSGEITAPALQGSGVSFKAKRRLGWAVGMLLLLLLILAFVNLYADAAHGYHEKWPVYLFAFGAVLVTLWCSYWVSKLL
jgi:hypothetical protein